MCEKTGQKKPVPPCGCALSAPNNPFRCVTPSVRTPQPAAFLRVLFCLSLSPPSRSPTTGGPPPSSPRRRRRPKPGAEAFSGLFTGNEHPPGTPTPSLPFRLCEAEHRNPSLPFSLRAPPSRSLRVPAQLRPLASRGGAAPSVRSHGLHFVPAGQGGRPRHLPLLLP